MKTLILATLFFLTLSVNCFSQEFSLSTGTAYGLEVDAQGNLTETNGTFEITPSVEFGKLQLSAVALTLFQNSVPDFYGGTEASYQVYADERGAVSIGARYLQGNNKNKIGGSLKYAVNRTQASANVDWNYKQKTFWIGLGLNYEIIR